MELRAPGIETTARQGWPSKRRQRGAPPCATHSWGRDGGLPRHDHGHDGEVEGVVVEDDAVLVLGVRGRKRMSQNDEATIVFHECFRAGCCDMRNFSLARPQTSFRKATIDGPIAPQADITMGVKIV